MSNFNIELNKLEQSNSELLNVANTYVSGQNTLAELVAKLNKAYEDLMLLAHPQPKPAEVEGEIFEFGGGLKTEFYNHRYKMDELWEKGYRGVKFPDDETEIYEVPYVQDWNGWFGIILPPNLEKIYMNEFPAPVFNIPDSCTFFRVIESQQANYNEIRTYNIGANLEHLCINSGIWDQHSDVFNISEDNPYFEVQNNCLIKKLENNEKALISVHGTNSITDFYGITQIGERWDDVEIQERDYYRNNSIEYSRYFIQNHFNNRKIYFPDIEYIWYDLGFGLMNPDSHANTVIELGENLKYIWRPTSWDSKQTVIVRATTPPDWGEILENQEEADQWKIDNEHKWETTANFKVPASSLSDYQNALGWRKITNLSAIEEE